MNLSELVRAALDGQRPRQPSRAQLRRTPPPVEPALRGLGKSAPWRGREVLIKVTSGGRGGGGTIAAS